MKKLISFHSPLTASNVDHQNCVIRNVSLITGSLIAEGHDLHVTAKTLQDVLLSAQEAGRLPVKINHSSGVENLVGYVDNFRLSGNKVLADWSLLKSHSETPLLLERAEKMPDCFGISIAFQGHGEPIGNGQMGARCVSLKACDIVAMPAANPDGLFSAKEVPTKLRFDNRPRTAQGMFAPQGGNGADPSSMAAAYAGAAAKPKMAVQKILSDLRLRKPVIPAENPMLSSKSIAFRFAKTMNTTTRQEHEGEIEKMQVALAEMHRRNDARLKCVPPLAPLSLEEVRADLEKSRVALRGFGALNGKDDDQQQPSALRDGVLGAADAGLGYAITDRAIHSLLPAGAGLAAKVGVGAVVGGIATAGIGSLLNQIQKRRQQQNAPVMANPKQGGSFPQSAFATVRRLLELASRADGFQHDIQGAPLSGRVTHDKYVKQLRDTDIANRDRDLAHAGIAGGAAGALINRGKLARLSPLRRAGIGALTGAAAVEGIRAITNRHRDIYGDRTAEGKAAEHIPAVAAGGTAAVLGGIAARKLIKSKLGFSIIRRATHGAVSEAIELSNHDQKLNKL